MSCGSWRKSEEAALPATPISRGTNRLIAALPRGEREHLLAACVRVDMAPGEVLCEPDRPYSHVHFPLTCYYSLVGTVEGHAPLEIRQIGSEGMLGATLALGVSGAPLRAVVRGAGSALRMGARPFRRALVENPALLRAVHRYLYALMAQLAQSTTCARFHEIEARLARWMLMTHDRAQGDSFRSTHGELADMLGVQRSAVTIAAGALRDRRLIRYSRGAIDIISRSGLEAASCECYEAVVSDYARRFG